MTRAEIKVNSIQKEIEKLSNSMNRYTSILEKKVLKCEKLDCNWTREEMHSKQNNNEMSDAQWNAWFDKCIAEGDVESTQKRLENAFGRLEKANTELAKVLEKAESDKMIDAKEIAWLEAREKSEDEYYAWLAEFKKECLKDGIIIDEAYASYMKGMTSKGKHFELYINNGYTERSLHSYALRIDNITYFTSGLFSTAYTYLKTY